MTGNFILRKISILGRTVTKRLAALIESVKNSLFQRPESLTIKFFVRKQNNENHWKRWWHCRFGPETEGVLRRFIGSATHSWCFWVERERASSHRKYTTWKWANSPGDSNWRIGQRIKHNFFSRCGADVPKRLPSHMSFNGLCGYRLFKMCVLLDAFANKTLPMEIFAHCDTITSTDERQSRWVLLYYSCAHFGMKAIPISAWCCRAIRPIIVSANGRFWLLDLDDEITMFSTTRILPSSRVLFRWAQLAYRKGIENWTEFTGEKEASVKRAEGICSRNSLVVSRRCRVFVDHSKLMETAASRAEITRWKKYVKRGRQRTRYQVNFLAGKVLNRKTRPSWIGVGGRKAF